MNCRREGEFKLQSIAAVIFYVRRIKMNRLMALFLFVGLSFTIEAMEEPDWQKKLDNAIQDRDVQLAQQCIFYGANPLIFTPCGECKYLVQLLDEYYDKSPSDACDEFTLLGMNFSGIIQQSKFDNEITLKTKAILYILMKASARNPNCHSFQKDCPDSPLKKQYRCWFYEKMELLEKKIDKLKDDCYYGRIDAIDEAVSQKVPLCVPDSCGNTLLHHAFAQNHSQVIKKLLKHDQTLLMLKNNEGNLPTDMAVRR